MAEYTGGSVLLKVIPSFVGVQRSVQAEASKWGADSGKAFKDAFDKEVGKPTTTSPGPSKPQSEKDGAAAGGAFADGFKKRVEAALRSLPDIKVGADSSDAEREIAGLRASLQELSGKTVGVDIDAASALAEVERISARLRELGAASPNVQVKADAAAALTQLEAVTEAARALDGKDVNVHVDVDAGAATASLNSFTGRLVLAATAAAGLGPALIPLGGAAAAALAGIGSGAVAGAAGIGVLALGLSGIGDAVKAMGKAQADAGANAAQSAAKQSAAAAQIASAQRSVESAEASLANTRAQAADAAEKSARRIADAQAGVAKAQTESAQAVARAQRQVADAATSVQRAQQDAADGIARADRAVADAERALQDAQAGSLRAQEDLNEARQQAVRDLEDMSSRAANAALDEQQAQLDLQKAIADNEKVQKKASSTDLDRAQALLDIKEAQQRLADAQRDNTRAQADNADAQKAGVEGSDAVVSAQERVVDANGKVQDSQQGVADAQAALAKAQSDGATQVAQAQQSLADAQANLAQAQSDGAARVAEAQQGVADAVAEASEQQRQSASSVEQAQRSLIGAQEQLAAASQQAGTEGSAAMQDLATAMAGLSPAGQAFATFLYGLKPQFDALKAAAQGGLLPGLQEAITALLPAMPALTAFVGQLAGVLGDLAVQAAQALTGPVWTQFFQMVAATAGPTLQILATAAGQVATAFAQLAIAFAPLAKVLIDGLASMATAFATWVSQVVASDGFQTFLAYIIDNLPLVGSLFMALVGAVANIVQAMAPLGPVILEIVTGFLNFVAAIPPGVLEALVLAIVGIVAAFNILAPVITFVGGIIAAVAAGVPFLGAVLAALGGPVTLVIAALVALGAGLIAAYQHSETFRDIVNACFDAVGQAATWLWRNVIQPAFDGIGKAVQWAWENVIKPAVEALVWYFQNVIAPTADWLWRNIIKPAFEGIGLAVQAAWAVIQVALGAMEILIRTVIAPIVSWLYEKVVKPAFEGISTAIQWAWDNVIHPVLSALGDIIEKTVAPAFQRGVDAIKWAWDALKDAVKAPVRFVVETVINDGLIGTFNKIAAKVPGVDKIDPVPLPQGFATGGIFPGYTPGKDIGYIGVSGGEAIMRPEWTRAVGAEAVHAMNAAARTGGVAGVRRFLGGFDGGGIVGSLEGLFRSAGTRALDTIKGIGDVLTDPAGALKKILKDLVGLVPGADGGIGQLAAAAPNLLLDGLTKAIGNVFGAGGGSAQPFNGKAGVGQWAGVVDQVLAALGQPLSLEGAVLRRIQLESGGNPNAINLWDSNAKAGHPSQGLVQTIPSTFAAYAGPYKSMGITDPFANIYAGMNYALHRYGSISAIDPLKRPKGYDSGGYLEPGYQMVYNGTGKPEPVLTTGQLSLLSKAASSRQGGGYGGPLVHVDTIQAVDADAGARALRTQLGDAMAVNAIAGLAVGVA
jgi:hypothetical protein